MQETSSQFDSQRILGLDLLRALAIIVVLIAHGENVPLLLQPIKTLGWIGVDLFFVLSGFLIGGILLREIDATLTIDLRRFYLKRICKIWPSYYAFLATWGLIYNRHNLTVLLPGFFHVQNYFLNPIPHTWSLAVEEHFYLALPFVILMLSRMAKKNMQASLVIAWVVVVIACFGLRFRFGYDAWLSGRSVVMKIQTETQYRIDSLLGGVALAAINRLSTQNLALTSFGIKVAWASFLIGGFFTSFLCILPRDSHWCIMVIWPLFLQVTFMAWLWLLKDYRNASMGAFAVVFRVTSSFIARVSYNTYLWHWLVLAIVSHPRLHVSSISFYLYFSLSIASGYFGTLLVEKPFLKLRQSVLK